MLTRPERPWPDPTLFRSLHHYRGSLEKAIAYYNDSLGTPEGSNFTEIERYCVWPGQATSYMVGQTRWVAIREKAKATLGDKFDLRAFHDTALSAGAMPIEVLAGVKIGRAHV